MIKYACITGADRGIGLALTKELLSADCFVFAGSFMPEWPELAAIKSDKLLILSLDIGRLQTQI
jgi:NAD(P)-dependent dehydrogenase (short-subunit alcohol dehydrogenase family)